MNKNNLKQHLLTVVKDMKEKNINIKTLGNGTYKIIHDYAIHHELFEVESFVDGLKLFLREKSLNKSFAKMTIINALYGDIAFCAFRRLIISCFPYHLS